MSINIGDKPEFNVVNVGDELTQDQINAITASSAPSTANPLMTQSAVAAAGYLTRTNTFNTADAAVRITQEGTGNSFVVEDDTNPDSSPFLISASGDVAIGTATPNGKLRVQGRSYFENTSGGGGNAVLWARSTATTTVPVFQVSSDSNHAGPAVVIDHDRTTNTNPAVTINNASQSDALRITNTGTGNSFVVEDDTNPDSSPFVINAAGDVGIGSLPVAGSKLNVQGNLRVIGSSTLAGAVTASTSTTSLVPLTVASSNTSSSVVGLAVNYAGTSDAVRITNTGTGNSLLVEDDANDSTPFVIDASGNVGIGTTTPSTKLAVIGTASFSGATSITTSGSTPFSINVTNTASAVTGQNIDYRGTGIALRIYNSTTDTFVVNGSGAVTLTNYLTLHAGALATAVGAQTYPDELEFKVGGTTYRVPARAI